MALPRAVFPGCPTELPPTARPAPVPVTPSSLNPGAVGVS